MTDTSSLESLVRALAADAAAARQRRLLVIAGEQPWGHEIAAQVLATLPGAWCWIGDAAPAMVRQVEVEKAHTLLGGEWHGLVYDARAGYDPDAFGAVAGTLRAGGLLLLLTPALAQWSAYADPQRRRIAVYPYSEAQVGGRFLQRLAMQLQASSDCYRIEQGLPLPPCPQVIAHAPPPVHFEECASADQLAAVEGLCHVLQGHRRRPLVLVSDRGRGKSTALGLAAARLLHQGVRRIVVTAPRLTAVEQLFQHAAARLPAARLSRGLLKLADGAELVFTPPDRLVAEDTPCDLLLVDEAAAIPAALLEQMLRQHARIAFATTVHGYEGTGRGFDLRFRKVLQTLTPQWRRLRMEQPIRWSEGDPLERMVFRALLLDAEPAADEVVAAIPPEACQVERLERDALATDEALLRQLFGLLILAHYRTTPGDLRHLLDGPNLEVYVLRHQQLVLATALVAREGGFGEALSQQIYAGQRRLRGNLLPQSLATHAGLQAAPLLRGARVMRIAVHPARQREGLGRRLLDGLLELVAVEGCDYLGASFGGDVQLLDFWRDSGCRTVRIGLKREASSGAHALMMMRPLSAAGEALYAQARRRLAGQLPTLLSEPLASLEPQLVAGVLRHSGREAPAAEAWRDSCSFAFAQRDYGNCLSGLRECLLFALSDAPGLLSEAQQTLAITKVLQLRPWSELVNGLKLDSQRAATEQLRGLFQLLCRHYAQHA